MRNLLKYRFAAVAAGLMLWMAAAGQVDVHWQAGATVNSGSGALAPYHIASLRGGTVTQQHSTLLHAGIAHELDTTQRLSWGAGMELWGGWASSAAYSKYDQMHSSLTSPLSTTHNEHPARAWVQQAWAEGKWRGVRLTLGAKHAGSPLLNDDLTSGDLTRSGNARPMVGVSGGFVNFQTVPFTHGWLQVNGEVGYYKPGDNQWLEHHYNYYNHFLTTGWWMNYKNLYFRSHPQKPLVVTIGMQAACQFGGTNVTYVNGTATNRVEQKANAEAFLKALIPGHGGSHVGDKVFFEGNHLGSWDLLLDYRLRGGTHLRAYCQKPWEDGSGIGLRNGFDGLWGVEWRAAQPGWVTGAVVEYLDLTNQGGPIHWAPADHENTTITTPVTGMDNYYNNYAYNGYHNRGMAIGTPMTRSPLYNRDGHLHFDHTVLRGVHFALRGQLSPQLSYRAKASWRRSWGTLEQSIPHIDATSLMVEATYTPANVPGLECTAQLALDRGKLFGNNVGALLNITYHGNFTLTQK
ncbi:MAG: hypothetical protein IKR25_09600 [Muribaculaceae bacterium]|nr:hypothetical protein [Muribaculaceae bacterium]